MEKKYKERVELHCHTTMSRLDSVAGIEDILQFAKSQNMSAVAFTDQSNVLAFPEIQYRVGKEDSSVKPIYGVEFLVTEDILPESVAKSKVRLDNRPAYHVLALVKNAKGLNNLYKLLSLANAKGGGKVPRISWSQILKMRGGLLIGSACSVGELFHSILKEVPNEAVLQIASRYDFLEVQPASNDAWLIFSDKAEKITCIEDIQVIQKQIVQIGKSLNIPVVATSDVHYLRPENALSREMLNCGRGWLYAPSRELYFRTTEEMLKEFSFLSDETAYKIVIENTNLIAEQIEKMKPISKERYVPRIKEDNLKLRALCEGAVVEKYQKEGQVPQEVLLRLEKELANIEKYGFATIYLHFHDIIYKNKLSSSQYYLKGQGASSLVAYLLEISQIDPFLEECYLYDELFAGQKGNREPDFHLRIDAGIWKQVRDSLNELEEIDVALLATTCSKLTYKEIAERIEKYESDHDRVLTEEEKERVTHDLKSVRTTKGESVLNRYFMIPDKEIIMDYFPMDRDGKNAETVLHFDYRDFSNQFYVYDILPTKVLTLFHRLEEVTGYRVSRNDMSDKLFLDWVKKTEGIEYPGTTLTKIRKILAADQVYSFMDYVRAISILHGKGLCKEDTLITVEDVFELLLGYGMPREEAFAFSEKVGRGRFFYGERNEEWIREIKKYGVPDSFIEYCKRIKCLDSRADSAESARVMLGIVFYCRNYAMEYQTVYKEIFGE